MSSAVSFAFLVNRGKSSAGRTAQLGALPAPRHLYWLSHLRRCTGEIIFPSLPAQPRDKPFLCPFHGFLCYFLPPRLSMPVPCTISGRSSEREMTACLSNSSGLSAKKMKWKVGTGCWLIAQDSPAEFCPWSAAGPLDPHSATWEEISSLSYVIFITFLLIAFVVRW